MFFCGFIFVELSGKDSVGRKGRILVFLLCVVFRFLKNYLFCFDYVGSSLWLKLVFFFFVFVKMNELV